MDANTLNRTLQKAFPMTEGNMRPVFTPETCSVVLGRELYRQMPDYGMRTIEMMNFVRAIGTSFCPLDCPGCRFKDEFSGDLPAMLPH